MQTRLEIETEVNLDMAYYRLNFTDATNCTLSALPQ